MLFCHIAYIFTSWIRRLGFLPRNTPDIILSLIHLSCSVPLQTGFFTKKYTRHYFIPHSPVLLSSFAEANGCYGSMNASMLNKLSLTAPPWDQEFAPWWQNEKPAATNTSKNLCTANTGSWEEEKMRTIKQYANQTDSNFLRPTLHLTSWNSASRVYCRILCRPDG